MVNSCLSFGAFVILLLLLPISVKADEWDLSKTTSEDSNHLQKWCKPESNLVRYSNLNVSGYQPCGELKTMVVCDASGKKLISSGPAPYGFKDCSVGPRIIIERIGPPLSQPDSEDEVISLAKNTPKDPSEQISDGLKIYQDYISQLDQLADEEPTAKKRRPVKSGVANIDGLKGSISPVMIQQAMELLNNLGPFSSQ